VGGRDHCYEAMPLCYDWPPSVYRVWNGEGVLVRDDGAFHEGRHAPGEDVRAGSDASAQ